MKRLRVVIVGSGKMAHIRAKAFAALEQIEICGVAAKHISSARTFAHTYNISYYTDNYLDLLCLEPDVVLIETPHLVQDEVALWALDNDLHLLIGGCLSTNSQLGSEIVNKAKQHNLIVECGYEARYKPCWHFVKDQLQKKTIGEACFINATALWPAKENSWYSHQNDSGGMPVTHMTYAFLNPLRWLFGEPIELSAMSNRINPHNTDYVNEQTCITNIRFKDDLLVSLTAGYLSVPSVKHWQLEIIGTEGMILINPGDLDSGEVIVTNDQVNIKKSFSESPNAFGNQVAAFVIDVMALLTNKQSHTRNCVNPASDSLADILLAETIVESAHSHRTIQLLAHHG